MLDRSDPQEPTMREASMHETVATKAGTAAARAADLTMAAAAA